MVTYWKDFSNPKVKRITFAFVLGNKDDQKLWIISLFNSCGWCGTARTTDLASFHSYSNQFHFQKMRWWEYTCHKCIQQHWKSWRKFWLLGYFKTSQKDVIKVNFIYQISLNFKPIFYTTDIQSCDTLLWRICAQEKKISERVWERCTLSLKSAYRTYVLCISMFWRKLPFKWYRSNQYAHEYGCKKNDNKII